MTEKEKLYYEAKEAYYNTGKAIMTDQEFDELERELGLENQGQVGTSKNPSYTVKHPYIMGSLSKVQVHDTTYGHDSDKEYEVFTDAFKYFGIHDLVATPKYDGCSMEIVIENREIVSISSRGDGKYGRDLSKHLMKKLDWLDLSKFPTGKCTLRGEVLVSKKVFEEKHKDDFANPRSFVSGVLNADYSDSLPIEDLEIVIYDYRVKLGSKWIEIDPEEVLDSHTPKYMIRVSIPTTEWFWATYDRMAAYRERCEFALDGFVIKRRVDLREDSTKMYRPTDCVAIKFKPMLKETTVTNITWNLGKTHEYTPIIWVDPIELDGKIVQKCSGHNIKYLRDKGVTIGAKVIVSLAGDIIPFLYKVTEPNPTGEIPMPTDYGSYEYDGHLVALVDAKSRVKMKFLNSAKTLRIPNIGDSTAKDIYEHVTNEDEDTADFFGEALKRRDDMFNILLCTPKDIYDGAGGGKLGENAMKAFKKFLEQLTLADIIKSCNFKACGDKISAMVAQYMLTGEADFTGLNGEGYLWVYMGKTSYEYREVETILKHLGKTLEDFKQDFEENAQYEGERIPVILTGEPNNYASKAEFLKLNPQYRMTGKWSEVKIVFTNSLDSKTGKMKKAKEKGIEIQTY